MFKAPATATNLVRVSSPTNSSNPARSVSEPDRAPAFVASVLVIEEDRAFRSLAIQYLKDLGYDVRTAMSALARRYSTQE